ncbi:oxygenase MpaB family protein, partial [Gordonia sp. HS-NH1]|uniref:oxygenase MpaB family protein n=1 Tax=Gordonia sp. HS-NH1 TaxID=1435068 RepID=UPI0006E2F965
MMSSDYAAAVEAAPGHTPGRKWIARRLQHLDPDTDYVEIVRLSTLYHLNDMQLDWFYTVGTPAAGIKPAVNDAVIRNQNGKYVTQATKRRDDSVDHMLTWLEHGAQAMATHRSIEMVNKYHAHYAAEYPSGFDDVEDYIYILCLNATLVNTAQKRLGLSGFDAKQRHAMHRLWAGVADNFTLPDGRSVTDIAPFPESYEAMEQLVSDYIDRPWPVHQPSHISTAGGIERFASTWFPRPLRPLGRAVVTAFMPDGLLRAHDVPRPSPIAAWFARTVMRTMIVLSTKVLADPREDIQERRRRLADEGTTKRSVVDVAVHRRPKKQTASATTVGMCPGQAPG